jgi:hypothetical protein
MDNLTGSVITIAGVLVLAYATLAFVLVGARALPKLAIVASIICAALGYLVDGGWSAIFGAYVGLMIAAVIGARRVRRFERALWSRTRHLAAHFRDRSDASPPPVITPRPTPLSSQLRRR